MVKVVDAASLERRLDPSLAIIDARPTIKYLQGHVPGAVNLPVWKMFDKKTLELRQVDELAKTFGAAGVNEESPVVIYDDFDGQNAAMLAWTLEFLGHGDVSVLGSFMEKWVKEGRPVLYRPVEPEPRTFKANTDRQVRATAEEILLENDLKLVDFRSAEEYDGKATTETRAGHITGAASLPWTLLGEDGELLRSRAELERVVLDAGLQSSDRIVAYCSYGPRSALGYLALKEVGFQRVSVFDGSFHLWAQNPRLSVETGASSTGSVVLKGPCIDVEGQLPTS